MKLFTTILILLSLTINSNSQTTIRLQKKDGVYETFCYINGKRTTFVFDTGAADVSISKAFFLEGLKNGIFKMSDILPGVVNYQIASGEIISGNRINIRELTIGNLRLFNVIGSFTEGDSQFLLGQSAIEKFGSFQTKYENNSLILTIRNNAKSDLDFALENAKKKVLAEKGGIPANIQRQITQSKVDLLQDQKIAINLVFEISSILLKDDEIIFDYDVTNDSESDYKLKALSQIYFFIDVFTETGKIYSTSTSAPQLLSGKTINGQNLVLKIRNSKPKSINMYAIVNGPYLSTIENQ